MLFRITLSLILLLVSFRPGFAYDENESWNLSLNLGTHLPQITSLRTGLFKSPMLGQGTLAPENREEGENQTAKFNLPSPLNGRFNSAKSAIQFEWRNSSPVSMTFGFGTWEATAYGNSNVEFPIQGKLEESLYERKISMSYTEYHLGAKARAYQYKDFTLFGRFSFNEIFDIDYREDLTFSFHQGTEDAYQRILVLKAQTASLFSGVFGLVGEWKYNKTITFGTELGYLFAIQKVQLRNAELNHNFLTRDQVNLNTIMYPFAAPPGDVVYYLPEGSTEDQIEAGNVYKPIDLSFSGWQFLLSMNIYY